MQWFLFNLNQFTHLHWDYIQNNFLKSSSFYSPFDFWGKGRDDEKREAILVTFLKQLMSLSPATLEDIIFIAHGYGKYWEMTKSERCALIMLLQEIRPECAIEIGTSRGGSLSAIAKFSKKVYTLDTDQGCRERLGPQYPHVEFITGRSQNTLVPLLERLQETGISPDFILVDRAHSSHGIKQDLNNILKFQFARPLYVLMHDSFNPDCRQGILQADWADNPHVHVLELDFVTGVLHTHAEFYRQMWEGLALAILLPSDRPRELDISQEQEHLFRIVFQNSVHSSSPPGTFVRVAHAFRQKLSTLYGRFLGNDVA